MDDIQTKIQTATKNWNIEAMVSAVIADDPAAEIIRESLTEALLEAKKGKIGRLTHVPISPIAVTRQRSGLSQNKFAERLGISVNTLRSWEQGQRNPSGAAATLLNLLHKRPELVAEL
ncbi:helix-turn-helix domain-containing protein [Pasteurellaceae bacterium USgator11]|nr:helix-turn-helix domain-containing protein [Pasteurellaceae bacterium USgator41]TNG94832.1 helix-turn-helix domain-containing protein [Pasteurellaceae bacterium UScroc12]TNH00235.1 helix-turn-helix domain-containing protein [Pasteurellaceae bacterium UScroc31]TNH02487.1 helix-turn-helix domain-containing protein [Pasteurellaceae bacterium USgator11]